MAEALEDALRASRHHLTERKRNEPETLRLIIPNSPCMRLSVPFIWRNEPSALWTLRDIDRRCPFAFASERLASINWEFSCESA